MALTRFILPSTLAVLVAAPSLYAGDKVKYGFEAFLSHPTGDLKTDTNNKVGGGLAFQVSFDLGNGYMVRPRLEGGIYSVQYHEHPNSDDSDRTTLSHVGLGCDYLYSFGGDVNKGLYFTSGLSVQRWSVNMNTTINSGHTTTQSVSHTRTSLGTFAGAGYQFKRWFGLEGRYFASGYEGVAGSPLYQANTSGAGVHRTAGAFQVATTFRW